MQIGLELLAPARNADIGIAAIDCGADAVYIAGPAFGARAAAGNPVDEIARLCRYAHLYGAKIHATVNTLLQGGEVLEALDLMWALYEAGVDVFIVQDLTLLEHPLPPVELHASTQTAIRTPERAQELEALGFSALVLERQLSLDEIRAIRAAVDCELEFFIHGALCVGYSGECYLSQQLTGRSANRGVCAQACRSRYDLVDADGRVLVRDQSLLSPKDLRFDARLADLVGAGITSFKIEGRLKNASYVKNVVRHYRNVIDRLIASSPVLPDTDQSVLPGVTRHLYRRASAGRVEGGFTPDPNRTFGRGWTEAFLDGRVGMLQSVDAAKALGEYIGEIVSVRGRTLEIRTDKMLTNGDGLSFALPGEAETGERIIGGRADVVQGRFVTLREPMPLVPGTRVYRNFDVRFERELEKNMPKRILDVAIDWYSHDGKTRVTALTEEGVTVESVFEDTASIAEKPETALENLHRQLGRHTGPFAFALRSVDADPVRFYPAAFLNGIRRDLAAALQERLETSRPGAASHSRQPVSVQHIPVPGASAHNVSTLDIPAELLRSRYCIRWEQGLCPKRCPVKPGMAQPAATPGMADTCHPRPDRGAESAPSLYLVNQKNRLKLVFDCARCEMAVVAQG